MKFDQFFRLKDSKATSQRLEMFSNIFQKILVYLVELDLFKLQRRSPSSSLKIHIH